MTVELAHAKCCDDEGAADEVTEVNCEDLQKAELAEVGDEVDDGVHGGSRLLRRRRTCSNVTSDGSEPHFRHPDCRGKDLQPRV